MPATRTNGGTRTSASVDPSVDGLRAAFLDNWVETDPELYDPEYDHFPLQPSPGSTTAMLCARRVRDGMERHRHSVPSPAAGAEKSIRITTAYFVPEPELMTQLCDAGDRGIDVQVLLPGPHADKRFVRLAGQSVRTALGHGVHHLVLPADDAPRKGAHCRRCRSDASVRPTSTAARRLSTRRSTSSPSIRISSRCSTVSSMRTSNAASTSTRRDGSTDRCAIASRRRSCARSGETSRPPSVRARSGHGWPVTSQNERWAALTAS